MTSAMAAQRYTPFVAWKRDRRTRESRLAEAEYTRIVAQLGREPSPPEKTLVEEVARLTVKLGVGVADPFVRVRIINTIARLQRKLGIEIGPPAPEDRSKVDPRVSSGLADDLR